MQIHSLQIPPWNLHYLIKKSPLESQCRGNLGFQWGFFTFTHTLNTHFSHILIIGRVYQLIRQITLSVAFPVPNLSVFYISCTLICIISAFMLICGFVQILQFILQKRQLSFSPLSPRVFFQTYSRLQISKMVYKVVIISSISFRPRTRIGTMLPSFIIKLSCTSAT